MCQTSVFMEKEGVEELMLENVTNFEILENSLKITTLFEGEKEYPAVKIDRIDFTNGKVYLSQLSQKSNS